MDENTRLVVTRGGRKGDIDGIKGKMLVTRYKVTLKQDVYI